MPTSSTGSKGFTLVELTVVIVIIAVLATMVIPRMSGSLGTAEVRRDGEVLRAVCRYARNLAVTRRSPCRLVIDAGERRYGLECAEERGPAAPGEFAAIRTGPGRGQHLGGGVTFGRVWTERAGASPADAGIVTFHPTGQADGAVIEVTDGRRTYSLVVVPSSGRVLLVEGTVASLPDDRRDLDE